MAKWTDVMPCGHCGSYSACNCENQLSGDDLPSPGRDSGIPWLLLLAVVMMAIAIVVSLPSENHNKQDKQKNQATQKLAQDR